MSVAHFENNIDKFLWSEGEVHTVRCYADDGRPQPTLLRWVIDDDDVTADASAMETYGITDRFGYR